MRLSLLAALLTLLLAADSRAGVYPVQACTFDTGYRNASWQSTVVAAPARAVYGSTSTCMSAPDGTFLRATLSHTIGEEDESLAMRNASSVRKQGAASTANWEAAAATWQLQPTPPNTRLSELHASIRCSQSPESEIIFAVGGNPTSVACTPDEFLPVYLSNSSQYSASWIQVRCAYMDQCEQATTFAFFDMRHVTAWVEDNVTPAVTLTGGSLPGAGTKAGVRSVAFSASDNVGIREATLLVDGVERATATYDCDYTVMKPCGDVAQGELSLDTATIPNGTYNWQIEVVDGAGNARLSPLSSVTLANQDVKPPVVTASGRWASLDGQYVDGTGAYPLSIEADDPLSGVQSVALQRVGAGEVFSAGAPCDAAGCPTHFENDGSVVATTLPEGRHEFRAAAVDRSGLTGFSESWTVNVDRTAPAAPTGIDLGDFDDSTHRGAIAWELSEDPALPGGFPGSGVSRAEARYRIAGGAFSEWISADEGVDFTGGSTGESITVEVRAVDNVGNVSSTATSTLVLAPEAVPDDVIFGINTENESSARTQAAQRVRGCGVDRTIRPQKLDADGYDAVKFRVSAQLVCIRGSDVFNKVTLKVCQQLEIGGQWRDFDFRGDDDCETKTLRNPGTQTATVHVDKMCYPGLHNVRLFYRETGYRTGRRPLVDRREGLHSELFRCNEDAAWRYIATRPSSPSRTLGNALRDDGERPPGAPGASGNKGFAAHHIVAANMSIRNAPRAQSLAYSCETIEPNESENGVWLRGRSLYAAGEGNPPAAADSRGYGRLPASGKRRAYHPAIHTRQYFDFTAEYLDPAVGQNFNCDDGAALARIGSLEGLLKENQLPYGGPPGADAPPGQD